MLHVALVVALVMCK